MPSCKDYKKNKTLNPYLEDIAEVDSKLKDEIDQNKKDLKDLSGNIEILSIIVRGIGGSAFSENDIVNTPNHRTIGSASTTTQVLGTLTIDGGFYDPSLIEEISATPDRDLTSAVVNTTVICSTAITSGTIKLPQSTDDNKGLVIKIMFQESSACNISLANSGGNGSTFTAGRITLGQSQGYAGKENVVFSIVNSNNAKTIVLDSDSATKGGGGVGSSYIFTYYGQHSTLGTGKIFVEGYGLTTATPAITPDCTSATGFS